tara:strand:- start:96 stop:446 length:351 start_codon:yes stop_codon:yes gene_type:complete
MKLTKTQLKQIIKEELEAALDESQWQDNVDADAKCAKKHKRNSPEYEKCLDEQGIAENLDEKKDDNWIQDAEKDIERRGTEGVCTGKNFGSDKCPPGSKRYNLAKTFRKMAKDRKK